MTSAGANTTAGLLDFNNMTEDNVMAIADKADELIEIIKNIKATVKGDTVEGTLRGAPE